MFLWDQCDDITREGTDWKESSTFFPCVCVCVCVCRTSPDTKRPCQHLLSSANNSEAFLRVLNPLPPAI